MLKSFYQTSSLRKACSSLVWQQLRAASTEPFKAADLQIELTKNPRPKPDPNNLVFGKELSDHMLIVDYEPENGWGKPRIQPLAPLSIHPASKVLHYALELFEGMKAYRGEDGKIRLFRPDKNMERMRMSAERCCFPDFNGAELTECIRRLVSLDQEWVPYSTSSTLYVRPTMIGTEPSLGVSVSNNCSLFVITGPVGPYFPTGMRPVRLLADPKFVRAWPGGAGRAKMGSNYAPTIAVQREAEKRNCQQVLWLFGEDHYITEVGTMNLFVLLRNEDGELELVTPPLNQDVILPGVTRLSLLDLARKWNEFKVSERPIKMSELVSALNEGRLLEVFGAGTACVVCPVEFVQYGSQELQIPTMDNGAPYTLRFYKELTDIQFGRQPSDWVVDVK